jgi:hypothetical protein
MRDELLNETLLTIGQVRVILARWVGLWSPLVEGRVTSRESRSEPLVNFFTFMTLRL